MQLPVNDRYRTAIPVAPFALALRMRMLNDFVKPSEFKGISDHLPHAQAWLFGDFRLELLTFNVLNPKWMCYCNMIPPLPWPDMKVEEQFGLEKAPFCQPENAERRFDLLAITILSFIHDSVESMPPGKQFGVVITLQECWPALAKALQEKTPERLTKGARVELHTATGVDPTTKENFALTLVITNVPFATVAVEYASTDVVITKLSIDTKTEISLINVHLSFNTIKSLDLMTNVINKADSAVIVVAGDWNVQVRNISPATIEEGSSMRLDEYLEHLYADLVLKVSNRSYRGTSFQSEIGWTNWNVRKNVAPTESNSFDHFDNILVLRDVARFPAWPDLCKDHRSIHLEYNHF